MLSITTSVALFGSLAAVNQMDTAYAETTDTKDIQADGTCIADYAIIANTPKKCVNKTDKDYTVCPNDPKTYYYKGTEKACPDTSEGAGTQSPSSVGRKSMESFSAILLAIEKTINKLLWPVLYMIGDLLENKLLFGAGMEERLREIWVPVRNIINILFVLALVVLALYNVLGVNGEGSNYSIKSMLPKLIIAIIAVNFSFVAIKVFLDGVNVMTTAIFAIPQGTEIALSTNAILDPENPKSIEKYCKNTYASQSKQKGTDEEKVEEGIENMAFRYAKDKVEGSKPAGSYQTVDSFMVQYKNLNPAGHKQFEEYFEHAKATLSHCDVKDGAITLSKLGTEFYGEFKSNNAALAMAINMGNIMFYENPEALSLLSSNQYESFTINIIFSLLLYVVYVMSFLALFVVLVVRLVVLWIGLALSPIIAVAIIIPAVKEKVGGELISKFVSHAIAPIGIAFSMTIGWIMMNAMQSSFDGGSVGLAAKDQLIPGIPLPGLDTLQGLLIALTTVAVVWIGVFASTKGTIAEGLLETAKSAVEGGGAWLAKAPFKYLPWVPVEIMDKDSKDGETRTEFVSPGSILTHGATKLNQFEHAQNQKLTNLIGGNADPLVFSNVGDPKLFYKQYKKLRDKIGVEKGVTDQVLKSKDTLKFVMEGLRRESGNYKGEDNKKYMQHLNGLDVSLKDLDGKTAIAGENRNKLIGHLDALTALHDAKYGESTAASGNTPPPPVAPTEAQKRTTIQQGIDITADPQALLNITVAQVKSANLEGDSTANAKSIIEAKIGAEKIKDGKTKEEVRELEALSVAVKSALPAPEPAQGDSADDAAAAED